MTGAVRRAGESIHGRKLLILDKVQLLFDVAIGIQARQIHFRLVQPEEKRVVADADLFARLNCLHSIEDGDTGRFVVDTCSVGSAGVVHSGNTQGNGWLLSVLLIVFILIKKTFLVNFCSKVPPSGVRSLIPVITSLFLENNSE